MTDFCTNPMDCCGATAAVTPEKPEAEDVDNQLYAAIESEDWPCAMNILEREPSLAAKWVETPGGFLGHGSSRLLPIHSCCTKPSSGAFIAALIAANPAGVREKDSNGQLPIHIACANGASAGAIRELLMACPDVLNVKDKSGNYPDAIAERNNADEDVMKALRTLPSVYAVQAYKRKKSREDDIEKRRLQEQLDMVTAERDAANARLQQLTMDAEDDELAKEEKQRKAKRSRSGFSSKLLRRKKE